MMHYDLTSLIRQDQILKVYMDELKRYTDPFPILSIDEGNSMLSEDTNGTKNNDGVLIEREFDLNS